MAQPKALGPDSQQLYTYIELPIGATAIGLPPGRKTGLWRYTKPLIKAKIPPCQSACPAGNWIQKFVADTGSRNWDAAWEALTLENPFPGVCGRVCYHPCETSCNRKELDSATSVHAAERYLADRFFDKPMSPPVRKEKQHKTVAVVGSGPTGLSCVYFLNMLGYETAVFEARRELGGIPQTGIPAYRLPRNVLNREIEAITALGTRVKTGCRVGSDFSFTDLLAYDAVFLATGAHGHTALNIPIETQAPVYQGLDFLAQYNTGQAPRLGKRVIVIGAGNVAIDVSRTLIRLGCTPILLYRRTRPEMPAHDAEVCAAEEEGLACQYLLAPASIGVSSNDGAYLECTKMKLESIDADGRPRPVPMEGETKRFEADQIILATGAFPDFTYLPDEIRPAKGLLNVNEAGQTAISSVFAGGDMLNQPWTVAAAIGSAKRAAIAIDHYLRGDDLEALLNRGVLASTMRAHLGIEPPPGAPDRQTAAFTDLNTDYYGTIPGQISPQLPFQERIGSFDEVAQGLDQKAAVKEAQRCLSCGVCRMCGNCYLFCPDGAIRYDSAAAQYVIDYDYCKGCGICFRECPVGTLEITTDEET